LAYTTKQFGADEGEKMARQFAHNPALTSNIMQYAGIQKDQEILNKALAVSTNPDGTTDWGQTVRSYIELGGRDAPMVAGLASEASQNQVPSGRTVTQEQLNELSRTATVNAVPLPDGTYRVEGVTAKPPTATTGGSAPVGREVTMQEVDELVEQGYKPNVEVNAEGKTILTGFGTFAPRGEGSVPETSYQEKFGENLAVNLQKWVSQDRAQATANINTYDQVIAGLTSGEIQTRTLADMAPSALGIDDSIRQMINPTGQDALDQVRAVVFQGLKETLGGAFSEGEANRLVSSAYNSALDAGANINRLQGARDVLMEVIKTKDALQDHFAQGGNIGNYKGLMPDEVLSSGIIDLEQKYGTGGSGSSFRAPSGITITEKK
jgi:hypothetical protein